MSTLPCAACGTEHETCEIHPMQPGDFVICTDCGHINMLGDDGKMRLPDDGEIITLILDEDFVQYIHAVAEDIRRHRKARLN